MSVYIEDLRKDYHNNKVIPFIGAGLSVPFNVPDWEELIRNLTKKYAVGENAFIEKAVEADLKKSDYWGAIDALKRYALIEEEDIQEKVAELILQRKITLEDELQHNYSDLSKMNFKFYLTTNYEHLLHQYLKYEIQPILLKDVLFNTQDMFEQKRVCHLHGTISNYGTIVLSKDSYKELYANQKYDDLLKLVTGSKKLLFMGFSFDDQFIRTLIQEHKESFKGKHYILLNNPSAAKIKELRSEYGLLTIPYNTENSSHTVEIRKILNQLAEPCSSEDSGSSNGETVQQGSSIAIGAGLRDFNKDLKGNLFFKKLLLEDIDESIIELSADFYIAAEEYIRAMRKLGMTIDIIDAILGQVLLEYKEQYITTYKQYGNSEQFLSIVHRSIENIDFGRYALLVKDNKSNKNENRGFVHILADNEEVDVWWGEERFDEVPKA
ncbi:SIR2 family protein [Bacillus toyonensis]|uniref:ABC-three component system protein n=1 Tax=Bacillus toyonensis TaxID=155322 RepID=UPI000BFD2716|nr:ABC-three component system protein [Bacillus toyonensis]PHC41318.1 SIR2 family protein [Bacillus toyonensis]